MTRRSVFALVVFFMATVGLVAVAVLRTEQGYASASFMWSKLRGGYTVEERLAMHATDVEARLKQRFLAVGLPYPPRELAYLAFKEEATLEVYGRVEAGQPWIHVLSYPILGMSGDSGPKLRQGDMQVPEGIYRAEFLNPNSRFHLSIRLNYPNEFDTAQALAEGRSQLGSDIMIHGTAASIGCLAMGNQAAEDLFILAALAGKERVQIVVSPTDFRRSSVSTAEGGPPWLAGLYRSIRSALRQFPADGPLQMPQQL